MKHFVGLDVSVKETSICVVKGDGEVILQTTVSSEPRAIVDVLAVPSLVIERIGLEAGPLSEWLYAGLVEAGLPAICVETRHMHAALSAQINKTDRNDALGIAQMMRVGLYKAVHVKTPASQRSRVLLTSRKLLQRKVQDLENELHGILKTFGLKVGVVGKSRFEAPRPKARHRGCRSGGNRRPGTGSTRGASDAIRRASPDGARSCAA